VISIGNLAACGRAKTPMAAVIAAALRDAGERPAILSRGYARRRVGTVWSSSATRAASARISIAPATSR
jgi:tetraacyldisaccharide 4'-kinase